MTSPKIAISLSMIMQLLIGAAAIKAEPGTEPELGTIHMNALSENEKVFIDDVDNDHKKDIVVVSYVNKQVQSFLQATPGEFVKAPVCAASKFEPELCAAYLGKFDEDEYLDLVTVSTKRYICFLHGAGDGRFELVSHYENPFEITLIGTKKHNELASRKCFALTTMEVLNNETTIFTFVNEPAYDFPFAIHYSKVDWTAAIADSLRKNIMEIDEIALGDFNGDGLLDLTFLEIWNNRFFVAHSRDGIRYSAKEVKQVKHKPYSLSTVDINVDGRTDIFVTPAFKNQSIYSMIYLSDENGLCSMPQAIATGARALDVKVGNFKRSGKRELAVATHSVSKIFIYDIFENGEVSSEPVQMLRPQAFPSSIAAGQINEDMVDDLVSANDSPNSNSITIFISNRPPLRF